MSDVPQVPIEADPPGLRRRVSLIWLIPLGAILAAASIAWTSYANQGRSITVRFDNGAGLVPNSTELRYRDVTVGIVERVGLSEGLEAVEATIRLDADISDYVDETAQFWVVRPEVTTQGITGLETVLSGVFIEGSWDREIGALQSTFRGRSEAPLYRADQPGLQISLRSTNQGELSDNGPIFYRGIEVGRIGPAFIDPAGNFAVAEAVIYEPHDRLISSSTRFWDTSGFSINVGAAGASIDFTSLASLVAGGITFETFVSGGTPAPSGTQFQVFADEDTARTSVFNQGETPDLTVSVVFDDNISGLNVGAAVELAGLRIGSVGSVFGIVDEERFGDNRVRLNAVLEIQPGRLGLEEGATAEDALSFLRTRAEEGLRAQLASASLLAGGLKVQFLDVADAAPAPVQDTPEGLAVLPTIPSDIGSGQASVEGVLNRVSALPVEELMQSAIDFLDTARGLVANEALQETPQDLRNLLASIDEVVSSDDVRAVAGNINQVLAQIDTTLATLEQAQTVQRLADAVDSAAEAAGAVTASVAGLPALLDELTAVAQTARDLPLDALTNRVTGIVETADNLLKTDGVQELPVQLNAALAELNMTLQELREGGAVANVNATLASARDAADAVASSTRDLPDLVRRLTAVLDQASTTIRGYDRGETLGRDAQAALRDIQQAASAVTSLARTLERNPSSLIRGRN